MRRVVLAAVLLFVLVTGVVPLAVMIVSSFRDGDAWGLANYLGTLSSRRNWILLGRSLLLSSLVSVSSTVIGVGMALVMERSDTPGRRLVAGLLALPLVFPPYVLAVGWFEVLGRQGYVLGLAGEAVAAWTSSRLFGLPGCLLVLTGAYVAVPLLLTTAYLRGVGPSLEEAGQLTLSPFGVLRRLTLPLVKPGILLAFILVFLLSLGELGATTFLRYDVFPVATLIEFSAFYDFGAATAAAAPLVLVTFVLVLLERVQLGKRAFAFRSAEIARMTIRLGGRKWLVLAVCLLAAAIIVILPLAGIFTRGARPDSLRLAWLQGAAACWRSLVIAAIAATVITASGFVIGIEQARQRGRLPSLVDTLLLLLFTLPGTVIGIGLILAWNRPATQWAYASPILLVAGFCIQYLALSSRMVLAGSTQIPASMEEAAAIAGASWWRIQTRIVAPLLFPVILTVWAAAFIFCARDVSLPLLLAPPGQDTLTSRTLTLAANAPPGLIAGLCVLTLALALLPIALLALGRRFYGSRA
jgi:iron(III) transport system permease protein